jgi:hypothetical protein
VELLRVGALGAVHVHDVHGRLLRRRRGGRVLLRLGRHGCCCCQEEEDQERATRLEERGTCLLHRRRLRGGDRLYSRPGLRCRGGESADGVARLRVSISASPRDRAASVFAFSAKYFFNLFFGFAGKFCRSCPDVWFISERPF